MMNIKRITCILLTLVIMLSLAACGGSGSSAPVGNGGTGKSDVDINTLADAKRANFPDPCEDYDIVLSNVQMDTKTLDVYLSKMIAAYDNLSAEEFCKYIYELNESHNEYLTNTSNVIASTSKLLSLSQEEDAVRNGAVLNTFNVALTAYQTAWKAWDMDYVSISAKAENAPSYQELKTEAKDLINTFSNLLYGKDMVF